MINVGNKMDDMSTDPINIKKIWKKVPSRTRQRVLKVDTKSTIHKRND